MTAALAEIEFLVRSEHRVTALHELSARPINRADLRELTGGSASTISRMLADFEDRGWVERNGQRYETTPLGAFVAEGVMALVGRMETEGKLREVLRWFPTAKVDFDVIQRLVDAEIVLPTESDPMAPLRRAAGQLRDGTRFRFLTTQAEAWYFHRIREQVVQHGLTVEGVITSDVYETLTSDPDMVAISQDIYDSGEATLYVTDEVPIKLNIIGNTVGVALVDDAMNLRGLVSSDDDTVYEWAVETFERYRDEAEPVVG